MGERISGWTFGVLASVFLACFFFYPLAVVLWHSASLDALERVAGNPYYWGRLAFTFGQALLSTVLTLIAGLPAALLFGRYDFRGKRLLRALFTVPFVMPTVVAAVGFLALLGPGGLLGVDLRGSLALILLAHIFYNYPVVVRVVGSFLESSAPRLREAAQTLGASPLRILLRVELPLAAPAIISAAALVFVFTFTSFGVILIVAPGLPTLEVEIYRLTRRLLRMDAAAVLVLVQLLVVGVVTRFYVVVQQRMTVALTGGGRLLPKPSGAAGFLVATQLVMAFVTVLSPLLALLVRAFWLPGSEGPSLLGFRELARPGSTIAFVGALDAVFNSLMFAGGTMVLALAVGFAFAQAVVRAGWRWLDELSLLPLAASAVTLGLGYLLAFPRLATSPAGLLLAHTLVAFPFVARALLPALRAIPPRLLDAAGTLGAGPWSRLRRVELPLLRPALTTAAAFAFAISMGEFGATLVISRPELATIPVAIFDRLGRPGLSSYAAALALSVILMVVTATALVLLDRSRSSEI